MRNVYILIVLVAMLISACSLDRSNPLDPAGNSNIQEPPIATGIELLSSNSVVLISFNRVDSVNSYYVYRSLTHNGVYERITEVNQVSNITPVVSHIDENVILGIYYFYKITCVTVEGLEGRFSEFKGVRVRQ